MEDVLLGEAKNGDATLISAVMAEEEVKLEQQRNQEEESVAKEPPTLNDTQFTKLDELLTQTQLYSEFLLEKMDDITKVCSHALYYLRSSAHNMTFAHIF